MDVRSEELQHFLGAANAAWEELTGDADARRTIRQAFLQLGTPGRAGSGEGRRLPVCSHLDRALDLGQAPETVLALTDYGGPITAAVGRDNLAGTQFHPEKSQVTGLRLIANFLRWKP